MTAFIENTSRASRIRPDRRASRNPSTVFSGVVPTSCVGINMGGITPASVIRLTYGIYRGLRRSSLPGDGVVDRDLGDVRCIAPRPPDAVHNHREGQELLPLPRRDVVGQAVDHLLEGVPRVDRLVREVDVLACERAERLVEDSDRDGAGAFQLPEELRVHRALPDEKARLRDSLGVVPDALDELRNE